MGKSHVVGNEFSFSDRNLKESIKPMQNTIEVLKQIRGVSYKFSEDAQRRHGLPNTEQIGFVSQELEGLLPQVVTVNDDGIRAVNYAAMSSFLAEVAKEQQSQIEELRSTISMLITVAAAIIVVIL